MTVLATFLVNDDRQSALALQAKPATDWSYYVISLVSSEGYNLGCNQGRHDTTYGKSSLVVLDFGGQMFSGSTPGTKLVNGLFAAYSSIEAYSQQFARGYYTCTGSNRSSILRLAVGTNNSLDRVDYGGGRDWGSAVNRIRSYVSANGWSSQVVVSGANDMEPSWNIASNTINWVNGYAYQTTALMVNYGSADGCPQYSSSNGTCNNGWRQSDVWWITRGASVARGLPEIYYPSMARQWAMISLYGAQYQSGKKITYQGPMDNNHLAPSSNTSQQAWNQLWTDINNNPSTASNLTYSVQIHYSN